jgi:UDP-glucuronate decarboxylase
MESDHHGPINFGNPDEFTIRNLAELIIQKIDPKLELLFEPLPQDDPSQRKPVIDKAKATLNWEPKIGINDGLDKTINYFKRVLN